MKVLSFDYNSNLLFDYPIGYDRWWQGDTPPQNYIFERGQLLNRNEYPLLYRYACANNLVITDENWQNNKLYGMFSYGIDDNTFRVPDMRGFSYVGYEPEYHTSEGKYLQDQIVNFTASIIHADTAGGLANLHIEGGAVRYGSYRLARTNRGGCGGSFSAPVIIDPSLQVKTGSRVQARGVTTNRIIKYR